MSNKHERYRQRKKEKEERLLKMQKFFSENFPENFLLFEKSENMYMEARRQGQVPSEVDLILQEIGESFGLQQLDLVQDPNWIELIDLSLFDKSEKQDAEIYEGTEQALAKRMQSYWKFLKVLHRTN
ncbi:Hypothetical predicted protein [Paramuricea clavata]|uniref:Uncharacterized protein n=1 Tax=Paramuricea clavata TaxID=317549 RepID=A0A7D9DZ46_PARCT|nr:Hypothetical predicted protein [Paramuricea clavata]